MPQTELPSKSGFLETGLIPGNCQHCRKPFDDADHSPRQIPGCNHKFGKSCIEALFEQGDKCSKCETKWSVTGQAHALRLQRSEGHDHIDTPAECEICQEVFDTTEHAPLQIARCGHDFGKSCIEAWLDYQDSCPKCREKLFEEDLQFSEEVHGSMYIYNHFHAPLNGDGLSDTDIERHAGYLWNRFVGIAHISPSFVTRMWNHANEVRRRGRRNYDLDSTPRSLTTHSHLLEIVVQENLREIPRDDSDFELFLDNRDLRLFLNEVGFHLREIIETSVEEEFDEEDFLSFYHARLLRPITSLFQLMFTMCAGLGTLDAPGPDTNDALLSFHAATGFENKLSWRWLERSLIESRDHPSYDAVLLWYSYIIMRYVAREKSAGPCEKIERTISNWLENWLWNPTHRAIDRAIERNPTRALRTRVFTPSAAARWNRTTANWGLPTRPQINKFQRMCRFFLGLSYYQGDSDGSLSAIDVEKFFQMNISKEPKALRRLLTMPEETAAEQVLLDIRDNIPPPSRSAGPAPDRNLENGRPLNRTKDGDHLPRLPVFDNSGTISDERRRRLRRRKRLHTKLQQNGGPLGLLLYAPVTIRYGVGP